MIQIPIRSVKALPKFCRKHYNFPGFRINLFAVVYKVNPSNRELTVPISQSTMHIFATRWSKELGASTLLQAVEWRATCRTEEIYHAKLC